MNVVQSRIPLMGLLYVFIVLSGFWVGSSGKPYNTAIFSIHKLIALATVAILAVTIYQSRASIVFTTVLWGALIVTGLLVSGMFVTGALLSIIQPTNIVVLSLHRVIPVLLVISAMAVTYLAVNLSA